MPVLLFSLTTIIARNPFDFYCKNRQKIYKCRHLDIGNLPKKYQNKTGSAPIMNRIVYFYDDIVIELLFSMCYTIIEYNMFYI